GELHLDAVVADGAAGERPAHDHGGRDRHLRQPDDVGAGRDQQVAGSAAVTESSVTATVHRELQAAQARPAFRRRPMERVQSSRAAGWWQDMSQANAIVRPVSVLFAAFVVLLGLALASTP